MNEDAQLPLWAVCVPAVVALCRIDAHYRTAVIATPNTRTTIAARRRMTLKHTARRWFSRDIPPR